MTDAPLPSLVTGRVPPDEQPVAGRVQMGSLLVDPITFDQAIERIIERAKRGEGGYVVTPNVDHVCVAQVNRSFRTAHRAAFLSLVDGTPLVWLSKLCGSPVPAKISGSDLIEPLCRAAGSHGLRVAMFGASPDALNKAHEVLLAQTPNLNVVSKEWPIYRPQPRSEPLSQDFVDSFERLRASRPDIVFIAMGTPNQELFLGEFAECLSPAVLCGIGAGFDFLAGLKVRAPRWAQRFGLEWLVRLIQEPQRMWRRYLVRDVAIFGIAFRQIVAARSPRNRRNP
jgi:N-acetylglucosaminyldiphosphoundecaprenol N-acetyl-beta-D-mannosaminyltransferase